MPLKLPDIHKRSTQLALGAVGAVGAFALYRRSQANSASATGTSANGATDPVAAAALDANSLENGIVGDLQPQIDALSAQVASVKTSTPAAAVPLKKAAPVPAAKAGVVSAAKTKINPAAYPTQIPLNGAPASEALTVLGSIVGPGGRYTGRNVINGAPVYAVLPAFGVATQGFNPKNLPVGTKLATLKQFAGDITKTSSTGTL
jgi:hypothetical protein